MSQIHVTQLTFYYDGSYDSIFENVSFDIDTNWKLGFIGRNGKGKTTFLQLLMGKYEYKGTISSSVSFDYFPFPLTEKEKELLTIDVIELIYPDYEFWKVCRECSYLQLDTELYYRPFFSLSLGEQTKVMLAVLFSKEHNFLLIDEPTNHLDLEGKEILANYLQKKQGFILVSHDRWFLDCCIDHVLSINKSNITVTKGNFTTWWEDKIRQEQNELTEQERLKKEITKLSKAAKQTKIWSDKVETTKIGTHIGDRGFVGHKAAKMMKHSKVLENRIEKSIEDKKSLLKNKEQVGALKLFPLYYEKNPILQVKELSIFYDKKLIVENVMFSIKNKECVVLQGKNGCGKSSILKCILGEKITYTGDIYLPSRLKISYLPQDTSYLTGTLETYIQHRQVDETLLKALLRQLDFERVQFDKRLETFSEGQKKKLLIATSMLEQAHLYIWDEPLNFIDIFSRIQIENLIKKFRPTLLMIEHDRNFITEVAAKVISLSDYSILKHIDNDL